MGEDYLRASNRVSEKYGADGSPITMNEKPRNLIERFAKQELPIRNEDLNLDPLLSEIEKELPPRQVADISDINPFQPEKKQKSIV